MINPEEEYRPEVLILSCLSSSRLGFVRTTGFRFSRSIPNSPSGPNYSLTKAVYHFLLADTQSRNPRVVLRPVSDIHIGVYISKKRRPYEGRLLINEAKCQKFTRTY